jgi:hypothetical protein
MRPQNSALSRSTIVNIGSFSFLVRCHFAAWRGLTQSTTKTASITAANPHIEAIAAVAAVDNPDPPDWVIEGDILSVLDTIEVELSCRFKQAPLIVTLTELFFPFGASVTTWSSCMKMVGFTRNDSTLRSPAFLRHLHNIRIRNHIQDDYY